jgi:hypothetical protein
MKEAVDLCQQKRRLVATLATSLALLSCATSVVERPAQAGNQAPSQFYRPPNPFVVTNRKPVKPPVPSATTRTKDETLILQSSKPIVSSAASWQKWDDYINMKSDQEHIPLTLTFENGGGGSFRFDDVRIRLAGRPLASIKDFKGASTLNLNLTDAIGVGDSLLTIQGYGQPGARLSWKLTTPKPVATAVNPNTFGLADKVTVQGKNFAERAAVDKVTIGGKPVTVVTAKKDQLVLKLGTDVPGGKQDLVVMVGSYRCPAIKVTVKAQPEVTSVNFVSTAPGEPIVVYGHGFSTTASDNEVLIGGVSATITSVSSDSISCNVPQSFDAQCPQWYVPIVVKTNGIESKGTVTINLSQRVIPNEGIPEQ